MSPSNGEENKQSIDLDMGELTPEEALRGFMEVDPEKVKERLEREKAEGSDGE